MTHRLLTIGLESPELDALQEAIAVPVISFDLLPRLYMDQGNLFSEHPDIVGRYHSVSHVLFHGIFEDDLHALAALALWNGPCFPNAIAMMDCRQRIPCLVRALRISRYGSMKRGFADRGVVYQAKAPTVAKWGEWHCGENKARIEDSRQCNEPTLLEPFLEGESVRIQLIGEKAWQVQMEGNTWLKSIHHSQSSLVNPDPELLEDARALQQHFGLEIIAVDYLVTEAERHLLEVNHIPSVTAFEEMRQAYLSSVTQWLQHQGIGS